MNLSLLWVMKTPFKLSHVVQCSSSMFSCPKQREVVHFMQLLPAEQKSKLWGTCSQIFSVGYVRMFICIGSKGCTKNATMWRCCPEFPGRYCIRENRQSGSKLELVYALWFTEYQLLSKSCQFCFILSLQSILYHSVCSLAYPCFFQFVY